MDNEKIKSVYENIYHKTYLDVNESDPQLGVILRYIPPDRDSFLVDAGCGNGRYVRFFSMQGYKHILGFDLVNHVDIDNYIIASMNAMPFKNCSIDFLYSNSVIYYLDNPSYAISEIQRILKPGGIACITGHTLFSLATLIRIIKRDIFGLSSVSHLEGVRFRPFSYYLDASLENGMKVLFYTGWSNSRLLRFFNKIFIPFFKRSKSSIGQGRGILNRVKADFFYHFVLVIQKGL